MFSMLMACLAGVASILLTQFVWLAAFAGIGQPVLRRLGRRSTTPEDVVVAAWFGFALTLLGLLLLQLFLPVDGRAAILVLLLGAAGLLIERRELARSLASFPKPCSLAVLGVGAALMVWQANLSMDGMQSWDSSLYHLQGVLWAKTYPAVPGLANLYGPLGFNNASFLYDALLDTGPWLGRAEHLANGSLLLLVILQALLGAARLWARQPGPTSAYDLTVLIPSLALGVQVGNINSFETHLPATFCLMAAAAASWRIVSSEAKEDAQFTAHSTIVFTLLAAAVAIKSSSAIFAGAWAATLVLFAAGRRPPIKQVWRRLAPAVLIAAMFALAWGVHGIVLSGYPAFPSTFLGVDVPWRAPAEHANAEWAYAAFSEREFEWTIGSRWFAEFAQHPYASWLALIVAAGACIEIASRKRNQGTAGGLFTVLAWSLPGIIAVGAWLYTAPALRYAVAFFWVPAAFAVAQYVRSCESQSLRRTTLLLACVAVSSLVLIPIIRGEGIDGVVRRNVTTAGSDRFLHPRPELLRFTTYRTNSGLVVNVPGGEERCWNIPLPCTPNPAPNLRLRDPLDLSSGFVVQGRWQMENFPYKWAKRFRDEWQQKRTR